MLVASDFLKEVRLDLQDKSKDKKFWSDPELFIKLQRAYRLIQEDLPYFVHTQEVSIQEGIEEYRLDQEAIENIYLKTDSIEYKLSHLENLHKYFHDYLYSLDGPILMINKAYKAEKAKIKYKYLKRLETENCFIELPVRYEEALRLLVLSFAWEKPPADQKERNLSVHYLKRYNAKVEQLKTINKVRATDVSSNYQRI